MSGTSLDAVDAALMDFSDDTPTLIATHQHEIPNTLRDAIVELCAPGENAIQRMGETDNKLGHLFSDSVLSLLEKAKYNASDIAAIGSHGQTIRHIPNSETPFTLQIGDPNIIAATTNITTVADFRRRDMALGGQAAPLAPAFHDYLFRNRQTDTAVLNIGGIANITLLPEDAHQKIIGFDTGPGNTLLDAWCLKQTGKPFDHNGEWALSGNCNHELLQQLFADPYFKKAAPKSTGREYFHLDWLAKHLTPTTKAEDVQATLLELTAKSIADALASQTLKTECLYLCGGGAQNNALIERLKNLTQINITTTETVGIHPDWIEAAAFAWLARQTLSNKPGNIPSVTGASKASVLGAIYVSVQKPGADPSL
ncbi:MAG: anhydro-N-acetylmuramic acid kinase, partial [Coxiellaceae bacterium]|nr:anhydro-N-acetylmuramic acid kinase [Coxiellaceae bacterium]